MLNESRRSLVYPAAALDDWIVLQTISFDASGQGGREELVLWHPGSGARQAVPDWRGPNDGTLNIYGATNGWIVVKTGQARSGPGVTDQLVAVNAQTGEARTFAEVGRGLLIGGLSVSGGLVAWAETTPGDGSGRRLQRIRLYDPVADRLATLIEDSYEEQHFSFGIVSIGGQTIAWTDGSGGGSEPSQLYTYDLATGTLSRYQFDAAAAFVRVQGVSGDGRYLLWTSGGESQFATDLETGRTVEYAAASTAAAGETYASYSNESRSRDLGYEAASADGGLVDLAGGEVRALAERDGCLCITLGVLGEWFVWLEATPITPSSAREPIPVDDFRFLHVE
jgi:hypothetical protein